MNRLLLRLQLALHQHGARTLLCWLALAAGLLAWLAWVPTRMEAAALRTAVKAQETVAVPAERRASTSASTLTVSVAESGRVLAALVKLAQQQGLVVGKTDYAWGVVNGGTRRVQIDQPLRGSYLALRKFQRAAAQAEPALRLVRLSVRRETEDAKALDLRLSWQLQVEGPAVAGLAGVGPAADNPDGVPSGHAAAPALDPASEPRARP